MNNIRDTRSSRINLASYKPITFIVKVKPDHAALAVYGQLVYRESRGGQVKRSGFLDPI